MPGGVTTRNSRRDFGGRSCLALEPGIFKLVDATPAGADAIHRITAELYCERMQFVPGGGA
jgi:hypothetical protein